MVEVGRAVSKVGTEGLSEKGTFDHRGDGSEVSCDTLGGRAFQAEIMASTPGQGGENRMRKQKEEKARSKVRWMSLGSGSEVNNVGSRRPL